MTPLSIGITTRNRPEALCRCLRSIASAFPSADVLVFDDGSDRPVSEIVAGADLALRVRVLRDDTSGGYIVGRNAIVEQAQHETVLLLDDDTVLLGASAVARGMALLAADPTVGAIAFAQAEADGRPWPVAMQPGQNRGPAYVPAFIGFAHLLRRSLFRALGGYRARFVFYGEEKDFCLRMLEAGYRVVYLPDALVAHVPAPQGRHPVRYVRYAIRNDCLSTLYNEPWPLVAAGLPVRLWRYRRMAAGIPGGDRGGFAWLIGELGRALSTLASERRPVRWATVREWQRAKKTPAYGAAREALRT
jgi:GT2 family glycosyltransferase